MPKRNRIQLAVLPMIWFCSLLILILPKTLSAQDSGARGLIVVHSGSTVLERAPAYEYAELEITGVTYRARLVSGQAIGGLSSHLVARVDYSVRSAQQVEHIKAVASRFVKAAPLLEAPLERLETYLAEAATPKPAAAPAAPVAGAIPEMVRGTQRFTNVVPLKLEEGLLAFRHDAGSFRIPAEVFPLRELKVLEKVAPDLGQDQAFQIYLNSFVPTLDVKGKTYSGVRLSIGASDDFGLLTDQGNVKIAVSDLTEPDRNRLEQARAPLDKLLGEIEARKAAARAREQERIAQLAEEKREAARRAHELQQAALEREAQMWGAAAQVLGGLFSQPRVYIVD